MHSNRRKMHLNEAHKHELWSIGARGLATLIAVLLFWGTTAPTIFHEHDVDTLSRYSGISATVVIVGCFRSSYWNLLTPGLTRKRRQMGFVLFWFSGSIFFNLVWQLPYWTIPLISKAPKTMDGLYWKIVWWSYTLHDSWYELLVPLVVAFEVWWLLGNVVGAFGLFKFYSSETGCDPLVRQQQYNESLVLFSICGSLQCYNATIYLFLSFYLGNFANVPNHVLSQAIFLGLNGFWACASATAATFAARILLDRIRILDHRRSKSSSSVSSTR